MLVIVCGNHKYSTDEVDNDGVERYWSSLRLMTVFQQKHFKWPVQARVFLVV